MTNFLAALRAVFASGASMVAGWAPDAMMLAGVASVSYGAWMVYEPAGFIVGGVLLLAGGWRSAGNA